MTKKDYETIAGLLKGVIQTPSDEIDGCYDGWLEATTTIADCLCVIFKRDNPRFSRERFLEACDITP